VSDYKVGDHVRKVGGDYTFDGVVVSKFSKTSGKVRYVVENAQGILHIFSEANLVEHVWREKNITFQPKNPQDLRHLFDSSLTCNYCGVAAESRPIGETCPVRAREAKESP
jgi:hypothetical protein